VCKHVGIPTPEFEPDSESEDNGEESAPDAQSHTNNSEAGASHED